MREISLIFLITLLNGIALIKITMTKLQVFIGIYYGRYLVTPTGDSIDLYFWPSVDDSIYINKRIAAQCINNCVQEAVIIEEEDYILYKDAN